MIDIVSSGFSDLAIFWEHIDSALKSRTIQDASGNWTSEKEYRSDPQKEEDNETDAI